MPWGDAMTELVQLTIASLVFGSIYCLASLGMMIIYNASGVVNFAFGALGTIPVFFYWEGNRQGGATEGWLLAIVGAGVIGLVSYGLVLKNVRREDGMSPIVATIGLLLVSLGLMGAIWGYEPRTITSLFLSRGVVIAGARLTSNEVGDTMIAVLVTALVSGVLARTRIGQAIRAVGRDAEVAELMGISSKRLIAAAWGTGTILTGIAGVLAGATLGLSPTMLDNTVLFAFSGAIIGGFGSLWGCLVGGLLVGVLSSLVSGYVSSTAQVSLVFGLLLVVLFLRPNGLFGRAEAMRA